MQTEVVAVKPAPMPVCECKYPGALCQACDAVAVTPRCFLCGETRWLVCMVVGKWHCANQAGCMARRGRNRG